jgi:hypothetical protein
VRRNSAASARAHRAREGEEEVMEVIFDTNMLRPVLSPTMKTALSVISLIGRSLVEANKCMKERSPPRPDSPRRSTR